MAGPTLTPEQQAALDTFETDAQAARDAHDAKMQADADFTRAQQNQATTTATDIANHQTALDSAKAFIDLMVPPGTSNPTPPMGAGKKGG